MNKHILFAFLFIAFFFSACGDDSSSDIVVPEPEQESSSSATQKPDLKGSSSSITKGSESKKSSSSVVKGVSSEKLLLSSSSVYEHGSSAYDTIEVKAVKDKSIAGFAQKGPFMPGSSVTLYALDVKTFKLDSVASAEVTDNRGAYKIEKVSLPSQYAVLRVTGKYLNEYADVLKNPISLFAVVDLSECEGANINLLTHLEYARTRYLMTTGLNFPAAKKQAEHEVLNAFAIRGDFANSEKMSLFGEGDGNAALLAMSILVSKELARTNSDSLLTAISTDIEKDGSWDDELAKLAIADWVSEQRLYNLVAIVDALDSTDTLPDYAKYLNNFWWTLYGLGNCDSSNEGATKKNNNERSRTYGQGYICDVNGWRSMYFSDHVESGWLKKEDIFNPDISYGELKDERDGKTYRTVVIGEGANARTWMAENLNYADSLKTPSLKENSWCFHNNEKNCDVAGRLYTWAAAIDSVKLATDADNPFVCGNNIKCDFTEVVQGICPDGWHLPNNDEWYILMAALGEDKSAYTNEVGTKLKAKKGWLRNGNGLDVVGFSAVPAGSSVKNSGKISFYDYNLYTDYDQLYIWGTSEYDAHSAYPLNMSNYNSSAKLAANVNKNRGYSVRCIKDKD